MLSLGIDLDNTANAQDTYQKIYQELCTNIIANTDERLISELEGLDVYLDIFGEDNANAVIASPSSANAFAETDFINIVYALKKKSAVTCS